MVSQELLDLILHGREERNLEYKESLNWDSTETRAKVTKACLALANLPDGGALVLGEKKDGEQYVPEGMAAADRDSFTQDDVSAHVNEYASPFVELDGLTGGARAQGFRRHSGEGVP